MIGASIGAGADIIAPSCKVGNRVSKYIVYILYACDKIYFRRLLKDVFYLLTDYFVAWMYGFVHHEHCKLIWLTLIN